MKSTTDAEAEDSCASPIDVEEDADLKKHEPMENADQQDDRELPKWQTAEHLKQYWETRKSFFTDEQRAEAWEETAIIVKTYSDEMIERWNKEIDTLLVYAGLFSAILTAFNVQSYQLLTPVVAADPVIVALERISAQLGGFSVNPPFVNSTQPAFVYSDPAPPTASSWAVWLNVLWFSSLIFSLSAASVGIMVKQWLHEYNSGLSGTSRQVARLRQLRLKSLERWHVKEIVSILPVLLQIASALFFGGLLVLLWHLNRTVAIVGSVLVGLLAIFSLCTIILPSVTTHCAYVSPPSRALFEHTQPLRKILYLCRLRLSSWILGRYTYSLPLFSFEAEKFQREYPRMYSAWKLLHLDDSVTASKWRWAEFSLLSRPDTARELDGDMVATAYTTAMDINYLHHAAVCTTELTLNAMRTCFDKIQLANIAHWGADDHAVPMWSVHPCMWSAAVISFLTVSAEDVLASLETAYGYLRPYSQHIQSDAPRSRLVCADIASIMRLCERHGATPSARTIAELLYRERRLSALMERVARMDLGNDVRHYVSSACLPVILQGLDATTLDDSSAPLALDHLRCIIHCVAPPESLDCKTHDPEYQAARAEAMRALDGLSELLVTSREPADETTRKIDSVFDALCEHGEHAGLLSPKLIEAMNSYVDAYEKRYLHDRKSIARWSWIQELKRSLDDCGHACTWHVWTHLAFTPLIFALLDL
ncbi:hypothetical protein K466DRAFT_599650 [Polyporus arcularius HHB13444]|uniref:DUF6535 domain-containing protein n=1 Tax=Polyporus arcularius HHB13444 TaxID=1314778 RepID=A0A5C3PC78_9APHY|nr:hypothetical protein K466DRAFT_599650 [Polyporus arcularius HHB13444]